MRSPLRAISPALAAAISTAASRRRRTAGADRVAARRWQHADPDRPLALQPGRDGARDRDARLPPVRRERRGQAHSAIELFPREQYFADVTAATVPAGDGTSAPSSGPQHRCHGQRPQQCLDVSGTVGGYYLGRRSPVDAARGGTGSVTCSALRSPLGRREFGARRRQHAERPAPDRRPRDRSDATISRRARTRWR